MKLWLVRHAQTSAAAGVCYGRTDVSVPAEATRVAAESIAPMLPPGIEMVTSPLQRCAGLAQAIATLRPDLEWQIDARLAEMDFGAWEERLWADIERGEFEAWTRDFSDACPGGSGESTRRFMQRIGLAFDAWRDAGRDAVWVTHAGVIRAVWLLLEGVRCPAHAGQWPAQPIAFGACLTIEA
ncbi:MAG: phosphoglycerate kinase [Variovorax sp.]|nr:MAG: phosphoglycerate kinase [Variovorax sp.]